MIIEKHGVPKRIYTDNNRESNNKLMNLLARKKGFEWIFNSLGQHNAIGEI